MSNHSLLFKLLHYLNPLSTALRLGPLAGRLLMLVLAGLTCLLISLLTSSSLQTMEERLGALGWTLSPVDEIEQRIMVVAIDEQSLAAVGPWQWPRQQLASLVDAIDAAGAQLQLHDIVYPEAKPGDDLLLAALQTARGAVLAQVPALQSNQALRTGVLTHPLSGVSCNSETSGIQLSTAQGFVAPNAGLAAIPKGHISPILASDGAFRKIPAIVCVDDNPYPALALSGLLQATNSPDWAVSITPGDSIWGPAQVLTIDAYPGLDIPLDAEGNLRISYAGLPSNYQAVSAADVLDGTVDSGLLNGAWVLVGATAFGIGDIVPTPYSGAAPGVELQARILGSLLDVAVPYTPNAATPLLVFTGLVFGALLLCLATAGEKWSAYGLPVAALLFPLLALALHIQLLSTMQLWLGWLYPALFSMLAASLLLLLEYSRVRSERTRVFNNLSSYLPSDLAKDIAYSLPSSSINASRHDVTLLSADLRNFSAFGEARPPEESAAVLHFFFVRAVFLLLF